MKSLFTLFIVTFISIGIIAQNNHIVKTDDGRRVLLKSDFTWEYIDLVAPIQNKQQPVKNTKSSTKTVVSKDNCGLGLEFKEPVLNTKTQALLKRSRSSIDQLKKKVAKKENCALEEIILISATETKAKGVYKFCTCKGKISYKRNGSSFFKKGKIL